MAEEPKTPRRPAQSKKPLRTDPYCLIEDDEQLRLALRFREGARACCTLAIACAAMYLHPDPQVLLGGGLAGVVYKLIWRQ